MKIIAKNSNYEIEIIPASFKEAGNLKKEAFRCLKEAGVVKDVKITSLTNINLSVLIDKFIEILLNAEISTTFENALFDCLKSCILEDNGVKHKITSQMFDEKPELREDYYEIISKCIEANLRPFFKSLACEFSNHFKISPKEIQEPEST